MAKYIPGRNYIGSSEIATDFDITGPVDIDGAVQINNTLTVGVDDTGHDVKFFGATSGRYTQWNESDDKLKISDGAELVFGNADDLKIYHDGSNSYIKQQNARTGSLYIDQDTNDADIVFRNDDGSGGRTPYLTLDGGSGYTKATKDIRFDDNISARFGTGSDFTIKHDGTDSTINNAVGDLIIKNSTDDKDIKFQCDDGSGGVETYFKLDGSTGYVRFEDNRRIAVGSGNDFMIYHDGTDTKLSNVTGGLQFHQNVNDSDIIFFCDDGSGGTTAYLTLDGSTKYARFSDNIRVTLGDSDDLQIKHDGTDSDISNYTGDLYIQNHTDDKDIIFKCDDGSGGNTAYLTLDGSAAHTVANKEINFADSIRASFGALANGDMALFHDGTNSYINNYTNDLYIRNNADDKDIIFQSDDGSGGTETYFFLDGSTGQTRFPDGKILALGTGGDLRIQHDSNNSYISQEGTGDLFIRNTTDDKDILLQTDNGSGGTTTYLQLDGSDLSTKILTQKLIISNLPTSNPGVDGQVWNNSGVLNISSG